MKAQVLLPKVFNYPFTYNSNTECKIGDLVEIPFGSKREIGVIWKNNYIEPKNLKLKKITKITEYTINRKLVDFIEWFSSYNMVSMGLVLKMVIGGTDKFIRIKDSLIKIKKKKIKNFKLNEEQNTALKYLQKINNKFDVSVLQGTTGSGKTLVYFQRIKKIIEKNEQALVLLPEIFLTNDFKSRFEDYFGFEPAIWHSKITPKQKRIIWQGVINNRIKILVGARSALLLPFKKLGLIIVDEEHDTSYKQDEGVIYNARDMAISRAKFENIPIHLVTAVPSIETFKNVCDKKYRHIKISKRYNDIPLPKTKIINLNLKKLKKRSIADDTINLVKEYLEDGNQVLFFLNRRGYAPYLVCKNCGLKQVCSNCSLHLTFHKIRNKAICHHCSFEKKIESKCKLEGQCEFTMYGPGVEKIFLEIKDIFPNKRIKIFSSDYLKKKEVVKKFFKEIKDNKIDILVGTQMISKGYNFPKLNCIVVVDADFSGRGYDLRSTEKNIQLYQQLSGRAGRFSKDSIVIYQTLTPEDLTLNKLIKDRSEELLANELILRKKHKLPPFSRLIAVIISSKDRGLSLQGAREIKVKLDQIDDLQVLGPVDSPLLKIKKNFRSRLLIRFNNQFLLQKKISKLINGLKISPKIKLTVDVDPINFA